MAVKNILIWPNTTLLQISEEITDFDIDSLIVDMYDTVTAVKGLGLAAIQIGAPKRVFLLQIGGTLEAFFNPKILESSDPIKFEGEGCLSLPGEYFNTDRFNKITLQWFIPSEDKTESTTLTGLEAVEAQHEMDHLSGKLLVLRPEVGKVRRDRIRRKMIKLKRQAKTVTHKG